MDLYSNNNSPKKAFNQHTGFAVVAPIASTARGMKLEVVVDGKVKGAVLPHQLKSLNYKSRNIKFVELAPAKVIATIVKYAQLIIA
ncbi:MAG: hypothetical protein WD772_09720 [Pseudohongiellaceae bacterium]